MVTKGPGPLLSPSSTGGREAGRGDEDAGGVSLGVSVGTSACVYTYTSVSTGAPGSLTSGRELTSSKETEARPLGGALTHWSMAERLQRGLSPQPQTSAWARNQAAISLPGRSEEPTTSRSCPGPQGSSNPRPHSSLWPPPLVPSLPARVTHHLWGATGYLPGCGVSGPEPTGVSWPDLEGSALCQEEEGRQEE